jgi:TP901 family phage tail tape measure protein
VNLFELQASIAIQTAIAEQHLRNLGQRAVAVGTNLRTLDTIASATGRSLTNVLREAEREHANVNTASTSMSQRVSSNMMSAGASVQRFGQGMQQMGQTVTAVGQGFMNYITRPAIAIGEAVVGAGQKFEKSMSIMAAYTHTTGKEFESLRALAIKMGIDTAFSATESADAITELSKAGMSTADILGGGLKGALDLAAAGGMKLVDAAELCITAMNGFKFQNLSATDATNTLAGAANASAADLSDLQASLKYCAVSAGLLKFSFDDTNTALALFSNHGLKGSSAGTALDNMLSRLVPKTKPATAAMKELGIITKDGTNLFVNANGEIKSLAEITEVLTTKTAKLTTSERQKALQDMFNVRGARGAGILFQEAASGVDAMSKAIEKQSNIAEMARQRLDNFDGKLKMLKSSLETAAIVLYDKIAPVLNKVLDVLTYLVNAFTKAPAPIQWVLVAMVALAAAIGPVLLVIGGLISVLGVVIGAFGGLIAGIGAIIAGGPVIIAVIVGIIGLFIELSVVFAPVIAGFTLLTAVLASLGAIFVFVGVKSGFFATAFNELKNVINILKSAFSDLYEIAEPALKAITQGLETFVVGALRYIFGINNIGVANKSFADTISKPAKFLKEFISEIKNFDKATMQTGTNGIPVMVSGADRLIQKFGNIGSLAVGIITWVKEIQSFNKVTSEFGTNGVPYAVTGADRLREKFGRFGEITAKVIEFVKFMQDFNKTSVVFGNDNVPHMVTGMDRLREKYPKLASVIETVKKTWDDLKKWLDKNGEKMLTGIVKAAQDLADKLSKVNWNKVLSDIKTLIAIFEKVIAVITVTAKIFNVLVAPVALVCKLIVAQFQLLYKILLGSSIIPDIVNGCVKWFTSLPGKLVGALANLVSTVVKYFNQALNSVLKIAGSIVSGVGSKLSGIGSAIASGMSGAVGAASRIMNNVKNTILNIAGQAVSWGGKIVDGIIRGLGDVGSKIKSTITAALPSAITALIPGFAKGVKDFAGGLAVVGEEGPELVRLPTGSNVYSTDETKDMMSKSSNKSVIININNPYFKSEQDIDPIMNRVVSRLKQVGVM